MFATTIALLAPPVLLWTARPAAAASVGDVHELLVGAVPELPLTLQAGQTVTITTSELSAGADPILHLLNPTNRQVASDDNGAGGRDARIVFRAEVDGRHTVVLRNRTEATGG